MANKAILIGNIGKEPDIHTFEDGNKKASFSLATSEKYKNKQGELQTVTQWHNIGISGKLADVVEKYVNKGSKLYLEGKITYREYEKDGIKRTFTEVNCFHMEMLGGKQENENKPVEPTNQQPENGDLPF